MGHGSMMALMLVMLARSCDHDIGIDPESAM